MPKKPASLRLMPKNPALSPLGLLAPFSLSPTPFRQALKAPPTISTPSGAVLAPSVTEHLRLIRLANSDSGQSPTHTDLLDIVRSTDETTLHFLINTFFLSKQGSLTYSSAHHYALITRILTDANTAGEIWNPLIDLLADPNTMSLHRRFSGGSANSIWSDLTVSELAYLYPDQPRLPTPTTWLSQAVALISAEPTDALLGFLPAHNMAPWLPILVEHASPITPRLIELSASNPAFLLALIKRTTDESILDVIAQSALHYYETEARAVIEDPVDMFGADQVFAVLTAISKQLGHLPGPTRTLLDQAVATQKRHATPSAAHLFLATDPTVPADFFLPLLKKETHPDYLAPLAGHADFVTHYKKKLFKVFPAGEHQGVLEAFLTSIGRHQEPSFAIDPRVMEDLVDRALVPAARRHKILIALAKHPSADLDTLRLLASAYDDAELRTTLALNPLARHDPAIRPTLLKSPSVQILSSLLADAPSPDCLGLWDKLITADPKEALSLLESRSLPPYFTVPILTLAPFFNSPDKSLRERVIRLVPSLSQTTARQTEAPPAAKAALKR